MYFPSAEHTTFLKFSLALLYKEVHWFWLVLYPEPYTTFVL